MADVTDVIQRDHEWFRAQFAALDELRGQDPVDEQELRQVWQGLADRLDVHAVAEERIFYPQLLVRGENPEDETLDAIGDHNDIRDATHAAHRERVGSPAWWDAVETARVANDEHMAEEEREGLADFRRNAAQGLRESLGRQFAEFMRDHPTPAGLDTADQDPQAYVREVEEQLGEPAGRQAGEGSLGIGSLKER